MLIRKELNDNATADLIIIRKQEIDDVFTQLSDKKPV